MHAHIYPAHAHICIPPTLTSVSHPRSHHLLRTNTPLHPPRILHTPPPLLPPKPLCLTINTHLPMHMNIAQLDLVALLVLVPGPMQHPPVAVLTARCQGRTVYLGRHGTREPRGFGTRRLLVRIVGPDERDFAVCTRTELHDFFFCERRVPLLRHDHDAATRPVGHVVGICHCCAAGVCGGVG